MPENPSSASMITDLASGLSRARAALVDLPESNSKRLLDAMAEFVADRAV